MRRAVIPTPDAPPVFRVGRAARAALGLRVISGDFTPGRQPAPLLGLGASTGKAVWKQVLSIYI